MAASTGSKECGDRTGCYWCRQWYTAAGSVGHLWEFGQHLPIRKPGLVGCDKATKGSGGCVHR
ncbi:hypothetical protein DPMN_054503 [Dreissena polymorpha]|uniref:Uncharacterized protein n=1 Tax=Dreissena polymorpha TaxID=45954 RepID=A0A9D4HRP3_DREPO|nr:hypothetical protein DPMN_054503 [Dreissena polymorpha]